MMQTTILRSEGWRPFTTVFRPKLYRDSLATVYSVCGTLQSPSPWSTRGSMPPHWQRRPSHQMNTRPGCCCQAGVATQPNSTQSHPSAPQRRDVILAAPLVLSSLTLWSQRASAITEVKEANIRLELAPDQSRYDAADPDLRDAANMLQKVVTEAHCMCDCTEVGQFIPAVADTMSVSNAGVERRDRAGGHGLADCRQR